MKRLLLIVALLSVAATVPAAADILYEDSAQNEFGLSSTGQISGDADDPLFREAWEIFSNSIEGDRILSKLDSLRGIDVRVEVVDEIFHEGAAAHGLATSKGTKNADGQDQYVIQISRETKGTAKGLAETLYHEFRHVEMWTEGDFDHGHDELHADEDARMNVFRDQIELTPVVINTPISDEIAAAAEEQEYWRQTSIRLSYEFEDLVDIDGEGEPTFTGGEIEIVDLVAVDSFTSDALPAITEDAEPVDTSGACVSSEQAGAVVCGGSEGALDNVGEPHHFVSVELGAMVPINGFDQELEYTLAIDSDGQPENNHAGRSRFAQDPAAGTDRWLRLTLDANTNAWRFRVWQVGDTGSGVDIDREAEELVILQGNSVTFALPIGGYQNPLFRPFTLAHDGDFGGLTGMDVWGALPTDPPVGLDGTRYGGQRTASNFTSNSDLIIYFGPPAVVQDDELVAEFCVETISEDPKPAGLEVASTLGDPPDGATATHAQGTLDASGCTTMKLPVLEPLGETRLFFFDGAEVTPITTIIVVSPTLVESEDP